MNLHQEDVLTALQNIRKERIGIIHFQTYTIYPDEVPSFCNREPVSANICQLLNQNRNLKGKLYFHPRYTYPSPNLPLLMKDLQKAAFAGGDIIVNGGGVKSSILRQEWQVMRLVCQCSQIYRGKKFNKQTQSIVENDNYRNEAISNKRRCTRVGIMGAHGPHKTSTTRRLSADADRCPFLLPIYQDFWGYFLKFGVGNPHHNYHNIRTTPRLPTRLLGEDSLYLFQDAYSSRASTQVTASLLLSQTRRLGRGSWLLNDQVR